MTNRLAHQKSPYLLQHAHNPVDWYPWGREALDKAKREDKPILVSIGYSACHWCHVMERESFEDDEIARLMNEHFVSIKVDREERPDVDAIYMEAVQALTGQGGWPLNVFLTPDTEPFYGGTYFPPEPGRGIPSWPQVLQSIADAYRQRRGDVLQNASALTEYMRQAQRLKQSHADLSPDLLRMAYDGAMEQADWNRGGFGAAPKFPQPLALEFVLRMYRRFGDEEARRLVELTAQKMGAGGIFDHLGGGFHRYTVDGAWVVPHFEKMLYDNALLARLYLQLYQLTHERWYRSMVEQTLDYLLRDMRSPEGGFYSAEDADSEGSEGKYYVWTLEEIKAALGPDEAEIVEWRMGVRPGGNFEGKSILTISMPIPEIAERRHMTPEKVEQVLSAARQRLFQVRSNRVPPGKDTKILVSWNGLAIRAFAEAGRILNRPAYLHAAEKAADFLLNSLRVDGRLVRSYKDGPSSIPAFLEDYAFLIEAVLTLYETAFDSRYLADARELVDQMVQYFWDDEQGCFFDVAADIEELVVRPRGFFDNPIPSGNAAATYALLRLEALTGDQSYGRRALAAFRVAADLMARAPLGFSYLLSALDFYFSPQVQIAIVGSIGSEDTGRLTRAVFDRYLPNKVVAVGEPEAGPLLAGRQRLDDRATAYVCEHFACKMPVTDVEALVIQLESPEG
jgi:uncharacterized protein YyaL (SSP411 family)